MAEKKGKSKKLSVTDVGAVSAGQDTLQRVAVYVRENPLLAGAAVGVVALILLAGLMLRVNASAADRKIMTEYAKALEQEDAAAQVTALEPLAQKGGRWTAEIVYMLGEAAVRAQQYDKAGAAFNRVKTEFGTSEYAPRAAEGLAFLEENKGNADAALAGYKEVMEKWSTTFVGRCQWLNIARVQEGKGDLKAAVEAYQAQAKGFPDSGVASKAEEALARLKKGHPELFPEEKKEGEAAAEGEKAEGQQEGEVTAPASTEGDAAAVAPAAVEGESAAAPAQK